MIRAVLLDLAGVVYQGVQPLPGAAQSVAGLRSAGLRLLFLTNTTRMPRRALLRHLHDMGVAIADEELFTPAQAARAWLATKRLSPHLLIHPDLEEDFANLDA
jgi:ribonucleotide monophosphatase NagD (HAD superfamily)